MDRKAANKTAMTSTFNDSNSAMQQMQPKDRKWQNELLLERLKSKAVQYKSFQDMAKAMRMSLLEKRYALDHVEKTNLQKCLDSMQYCIKVTSRQGLVERLESLTRQLGLKFMEDTSGLFISSDMFYLEIVLDANGGVQDVKVHHEGNIEQHSCKELVQCLVNGDFVDFTQQLEGLASIYQLNAEQKIKSKAFVSLQALETDLSNVFMFQNIYKDPNILLLKSSVGVLQPRRGGHPMKLTYFVSPYDMLNIESNTMTPLTIDAINSENIGMSVTVNLEASTARKLQTQPILMVNKDQQGRSTPQYVPIGQHNSTMLPASFVLRLNKPLPMCNSLIYKLNQITEINCGDQPTVPMLTLITQNEINTPFPLDNKGLFVSLPDQNHCYFLTNSKHLDAVKIVSVPFTEPSQVHQILSLLRLQAAFNSLIASCIRPKGKQDIENAVMFEVSAISCQFIIISLEHPFEESMATVEINLTDLTSIVCKIYSLTKNYDNIAVKLSSIVQKCMSIPITMRALIKFWEYENIKNSLHKSIDNGNFSSAIGPSDPGGRTSSDFNRDNQGSVKERHGANNGGYNGSSNGRGMFHSGGSEIAGDNAGVFSEQTLSAMFGNGCESTVLNQLTSSSQELPVLNHSVELSSPKSKKRRTNMMTEDFWTSPKSNKMDKEYSKSADLLLTSSNNSSDSNSLGIFTSILSEPGIKTPSDVNMIESSSLDARTISDDCNFSENINNVSHQISTFSITPTSQAPPISSVLTGMNLERRPGIEIIPYALTPAINAPSSITITPINPSPHFAQSDKSNTHDKKSSADDSSSHNHKPSTDDRKKKRRKREDSPMGPPEKLPLKNELSKPDKISMKTSDTSPISPIATIQKKTCTSPIHKSVPNSDKSSSSSPKHSSGSGKPSMSTLKSATNSPKHDKSKSSSSRDRDRSDKKSSSSSSGGIRSSSPKIKPSSVKLKQLDLNLLDSMDLSNTSGNSLSDNQSSPTDLSKPGNNQVRNRKSSLSAVIDKLKSAQNVPDDNSSQSSTKPVVTSGSYSVSSNCSSNKEKLQNLSQTTKQENRTSSSGANSSRSSNTLASVSASSTMLSNSKSSEYMVKSSSDGIKITINKTRSKESKDGILSTKSSASSLKSSSSNVTTSNSKKINTLLSSSSSLQKSNSSGNLSVTLKSHKSSLPKTLSSGSLSVSSSQNMSDLTKKDKQHKQKSSTTDERPKYRVNDSNDVMRMLGFASTAQAMEGFIKFQIPKLSARTTSSSTTEELKRESKSNTSPLPTTSENPVISSEARKKMLVDLLSQELPQKFPFPNNTNSPSTSNNKINSLLAVSTPHHYSGALTTDLSTSKEFHLPKLGNMSHLENIGPRRQVSASPNALLAAPTTGIANHTSMDNILEKHLNNLPSSKDIAEDSSKLMRPPSAPPSVTNLLSTISKQPSASYDEALDFSSSTSAGISLKDGKAPVSLPIRNKGIPPQQKSSYPASPSLSVHIVKSPVPSPLTVNSSSHSNSSPCITNDELMDEALVGISGK